MSLSEAVLDVAQRMEDEATELFKDNAGYRLLVFGYCRELRTAIKAAAGSEQVQAKQRALSPDEQHRIEIEKAKEEFRAKKAQGEGGRMAELVGGNADTDLSSIDANMPVGAKTIVAGHVYVLEADGKLHFSREETQKILCK